jgi:hypothetical protein
MMPAIEAGKNPFTVTEYLIHFERTISGSLEKGFDKLLHTYGDPGAALSSLEQIQANILKLKQSLYKECPELRKDVTISSFPANEGPQDIEGGRGEREMVNTQGHEPPLPDKMSHNVPYPRLSYQKTRACGPSILKSSPCGQNDIFNGSGPCYSTMA